MSSKSVEIVCPCCETELKIDVKTGEIIWQERKEKPLPSLSDMVKDLDKKSKEQQVQFKKRSETQKDRGRILDEIFKESHKKADKTPEKPIRDFDLD